jgi:hypothetical protein
VESKALTTLAPLPLVPTSSMPRNKSEELAELVRARRDELGNAVVHFGGAVALVCCSLLCGIMAAIGFVYPFFPIWYFLVTLTACLGSLIGAGVMVSLTINDVRAFCRNKILPELETEAAEEARLLEAAWELNGQIMEWNESARRAACEPMIEPIYTSLLQAKRRKLARLRDGAMTCLELPTKDP